MDGTGVKDTTAYHIIRQITDHIWGSDEDLSDEDILTICHDFMKTGGYWESLIDGSMKDVLRLEESIEKFVRGRAAQGESTVDE